jgi:acyl-CoA synthetase (NDP forming)
LERAVSYAEWRKRPPETPPAFEDIDANAARRLLESPPEDGWLTGEPAMSVLRAYGVPVAATVSVTSARQAESAASSVGFPVALKATGPGVLHKSDVGGVRLSLGSVDAVAGAYREMADTLGEAMDGAIVQPMAHEGTEVIVGFVQDPAFGPLVLMGLGGTAVELLGDYATCRVPVTESDAREMLLSLRSAPVLTGYRGSTPVDIDALVDLVMRCGRLAEDLTALSEADLNPVIAGPDGVIVVDARFRVSPEPIRPEDARQLA